MKILKISVLAAAVIAFTGPALACGAHKESAHLPQTVATADGPQTVVVKPVVQTADQKK